jgi:hypothetical protein
MRTCVRCGAAVEAGTLMVGGTSWHIRFRRYCVNPFARKDPVEALACRACGHIELVLSDVVAPQAGSAPPLVRE